MIVGGTVCALVTAAHLTNVKNVELKRFDDRFVEALRSVVIIDANGKVTRHVGHRVPALKCEMDARVIVVQSVKVEDDFVVEEFGSAQVSNLTR